MPQAQPELKKVLLQSQQQRCSYKVEIANRRWQYLDKRVEVQLNGSRKVMGTLRGYDVSYSIRYSAWCTYTLTLTHQVFLNIVLDEATESKPNNEKVRLGMCVIRGNSVVMMEALDRIGGDDRGGR